MVTDIEGWGAPERMGLKREAGERRLLARAGMAALVLGAVLLALGAWIGGQEPDFLWPLATAAGRWSALVCAGCGSIAMLLSRPGLGNHP